MVKIVATEELSAFQQREVEALEQVVQEEEGLQSRLFLSNRLNWDRTIPCFFLAYQGQELVSVLTAFFPTVDEIEFSGFTSPHQRSRGHFSLLVKRALTQYAPYPFKRALFTVEATSASGAAYLASRYPTIERTEYLMALEKGAFTPLEAKGELQRVGRTNAEEAARLMSRIFGSDLQQSRDRVSLMLLEEGRQAFIYHRRGLSLGVLNAQKRDPATAMIYGVGILSDHRSQGHAKAMMNLALQTLFVHATTVQLEVESTNEHALSLYTNLGFRPVMQVDYHALALR